RLRVRDRGAVGRRRARLGRARGARARATAGRRAQPFPAGDHGIAIGAHLGGRAIVRAGREGSAAASEIASVAGAGRGGEGPAAMLEGAARSAGGAAWGFMMSVMPRRGAGARLAPWGRHPRCRRAATASTAVLGLPLVLPLLVLAALSGTHLPPL